MSDTYDDEYGTAPKALRDHAKALEKQVAELQKAFDAEKAARAAAEKTAKSQSLNSILREKGIKPGLVKWLEKDEVEATKEAVDAWLSENGEFFNVAPKAETEAAVTEAGEPAGQPNVPEGMEDAVRASQALDASGVSPSEVNVMQKLQSIDPTKFKSFDELQAAIAQSGVKFD